MLSMKQQTLMQTVLTNIQSYHFGRNQGFVYKVFSCAHYALVCRITKPHQEYRKWWSERTIRRNDRNDVVTIHYYKYLDTLFFTLWTAGFAVLFVYWSVMTDGNHLFMYNLRFILIFRYFFWKKFLLLALWVFYCYNHQSNSREQHWIQDNSNTEMTATQRQLVYI